MLSIFVHGQRSDWDDYLPFLLMAKRSSQRQSTQCTPSLLMFGREVTLPPSITVEISPGESWTMCRVKYVEWVRNNLQHPFEFTRENLHKSFIRRKRAYDTNTKRREYPWDLASIDGTPESTPTFGIWMDRLLSCDGTGRQYVSPDPEGPRVLLVVGASERSETLQVPHPT